MGTKKMARIAIVWVILLSIAQQTALAQYTPDGSGTAKIVGKIIDSHGKKVPNARLLAYHLSSERLYTSEPGDGFRLTGLPFGYYDLAIETPDGIYPTDRVLNLAPSGSVVLILTLSPYRPGEELRKREYPGSEIEPVGWAELRKKLKGREYWRSPKGVAILSIIGGGALLALAVGSSSEDLATQF